MTDSITPEDVETLERLADLTLKGERRKGVADILSVWVPAANGLSRKMSEPRHRGLTPNIRFSHPLSEEVVER